MTKEEALKIIKDENLMGFKFFDNTQPGYDEVGIIINNNQICGKTGVFDNESDALDSFIRRLRAGNRYLRGS